MSITLDIIASVVRTPQFLAGILCGGSVFGAVFYRIGHCNGTISLAHKVQKQRDAHRARSVLMPSGSIQHEASELPPDNRRRHIMTERS